VAPRLYDLEFRHGFPFSVTRTALAAIPRCWGIRPICSGNPSHIDPCLLLLAVGRFGVGQAEPPCAVATFTLWSGALLMILDVPGMDRALCAAVLHPGAPGVSANSSTVTLLDDARPDRLAASIPEFAAADPRLRALPLNRGHSAKFGAKATPLLPDFTAARPAYISFLSSVRRWRESRNGQDNVAAAFSSSNLNAGSPSSVGLGQAGPPVCSPRKHFQISYFLGRASSRLATSLGPSGGS